MHEPACRPPVVITASLSLADMPATVRLWKQRKAGFLPVTDLDTTASEMLGELAELKDPVRGKIERYGLTRTIDPRHFFPAIESALATFRQESGAEWCKAS